ncbi:MAG: hypothetical protein E7012_00945 [Alphaproteobacteria bacterium]|nr:hypothetical protein [Alphaproteobacteria bacterium]
MSNIKEIIEASLLEIKDKFKDIDLEIGLQIELIIKLRKKLEKDGYKIIPEKSLAKKDIKREIDIAIEKESTKEKYAIELKMPPNKAMPKRMSQAIVDIKFLEKLVEAHGFNGGFFIMLTNNHCFWEGNETDGIYKYFRKKEALSGHINFPTFFNEIKEECHITGSYQLSWEKVSEDSEYRYLFVEV